MVPETGACQHLYLTELRRGYSNRAGRELSPRDFGRFRRFEMRPEFLRTRGKVLGHRANILLDNVEVENRCGRVEVALGHCFDSSTTAGYSVCGRIEAGVDVV